jgi:acetyl esterase/lipase
MKPSLTILSLLALVNLHISSVATAADNKPSNSNVKYSPNAKFSITISEVEFRKNANGRQLMARIYQPEGPGPFPTILDLHGGAWNNKDRMAEQPMDRAIAESGVLVVAIDLTSAMDMPYPANVQDANYGVRWLKLNAPKWHGDVTKIGIYGSSSGGHIAELLAMRPNDPRYNSIPLEAAKNISAKVDYIAVRSPISNPYARYQNAVTHKRDKMITNNTNYFKPWESIHEASPQEILDRKELVTLPPVLLMQGALDDNVPPVSQEKFCASYNTAGGKCKYLLFEGSEHEWVAEESAQTDKARQTVKAYIATQYPQ